MSREKFESVEAVFPSAAAEIHSKCPFIFCTLPTSSGPGLYCTALCWMCCACSRCRLVSARVLLDMPSPRRAVRELCSAPPTSPSATLFNFAAAGLVSLLADQLASPSSWCLVVGSAPQLGADMRPPSRSQCFHRADVITPCITRPRHSQPWLSLCRRNPPPSTPASGSRSLRLVHLLSRAAST